MRREYGGRKPIGLEDVLKRAKDMKGYNDGLRWWIAKNPYLDDMSPYQYCKKVSANKLYKMLEDERI